MPLGMEVGLSPGDFVLDGDPASPPLKGHNPQFLSSLRCGQTTAWMKTPLGTEIDLRLGHIVLDGEPASLPKKGSRPPIFGPFLLSSNGMMHQDATWYGGRPQPRQLCVRLRPSFPSFKGAQPPPNFRPMSVVAKRLDGLRWNLVCS